MRFKSTSLPCKIFYEFLPINIIYEVTAMQISQFFMSGDIKGAIAYMREHEEFKDVLPAYTAIFEDCKYRTYDVPDILNEILRLYQIYS